MDNFSISGWAHAAIEALPESHHVTIKVMARYAMEYRICNRSVRSRRPSVTIARPLEVPCGYYQNAINGTPNEDDKFFAQVQFIYNLGWLSELDSGSLVLTIGTAHKPSRSVPASRGRGGIPRRIRKLVFESDSDTCWLCGIKTRKPTVDDWIYPWSPTLDHVIPHSHGGSDALSNLRTAHRWCNSTRGNRNFSKQIMRTRVIRQLSEIDS